MKRLKLMSSLLMTLLLGPTLAVAQAPNRIFFENFDTIVLQPNLDEGYADPTAFSHNPPPGWTVDNSELNATIPPTIPGGLGSPVPQGVREWRGWSFVDPSFWVGADNQGRDQFTRGAGVVAVADPDEFDDLGNPLFAGGPGYRTFLSTPAISLAGIPATDNLYVTFDSSWRGETNDERLDTDGDGIATSIEAGENQTSIVTASGIELLRWESSPILLDGSPNPNYRAGAVSGDAANSENGLALNERVVLSIPRSQIAGSSLTLDFAMQDAQNDWWWAIDNVAVYHGVNAPSIEFGLKAVVNRDTGAITLENNSGESVDIRAYSVLSNDGTLISSEYTPLADVAGSGWVSFTPPGSSTDLSEGLLSGVYTVGSGQQISLGNVWFKYFDENGDLSFEYLDANGVLQTAPVEYVGNNGNAFPFGDLDFDGDVDIDDWVEFRSDIPSNLAGLSRPRLYDLSDLNGDSRHDLRDVIAFRQAYDAFNGPGSFAAMSSAVPEPSAMALGALLLVGGALGRGRRFCVTICFVGVISMLLVDRASAIVLLEENFDNLPFGVTVERAPGTPDAWTNVPPAGWVVDNSLMPGVYGGADDGVREFYGWNFLQRDFFMAPGQGRTEFELASGGVAVADPDEWDDAPNPEALFNTFLRTPDLSLAGIGTAGVLVRFDSSWRPEGFDDLGGINNQTATVTAIFDVAGTEVRTEILRWDSDPGGDFFKPDATNEQVVVSSSPLDGANSVRLEFGLTNAYNDWWWAIDNLTVETFSPVILEVNVDTGEMTLRGTADAAVNRNMFSYEITSDSSSLDPNGWSAGNLAAQGVGQSGSGSTADFNLDGVVDAADYTVWRDNLGVATGALQSTGDANGDGAVDSADYLLWRSDFGQSGGGGLPGEGFETILAEGDILLESWLLGQITLDDNFVASLGQGFLVGGTQDLRFHYTDAGGVINDGFVLYTGSSALTTLSNVPEPSALITGVFSMICIVMFRSRPRLMACTVALMLVACASIVDAGFTLDRDYRFGDNDTAANGPATIGTFVSQNGVGDVNDSAGLPNANGGNNEVITLVPVPLGARTGPRYVDASARPFASAGEIGVEFANPTQALQAEPLGSPGESVSSSSATASIYAGGVGPYDYDGITNRGFQLWVRPNRNNINQTIVHDTDQHAFGISSNGRWFMQYAQNPRGNIDDRFIDVSVPESQVTVGEWYHVMMVRPYGAFRKIEDPVDPLANPTFDADVSSGPNGGARLYVNGVAVAAAGGGFDTSLNFNFSTGLFDDDSILYVGGRGNTGTGGTLGSIVEPFIGIIDNLEMFVLGTSFNGTELGNFDLADDNHFIRNTLLGFGAADFNLDGVEDTSDVNAFLANWRSENVVNGFVVGDLRSRANGDVNLDGRVDLLDWYEINLASPTMGSLIGQSLGFVAVPEPSAIAIGLLAAAFGCFIRRRKIQ